MAIYKEDILDVELASGTVARSFLNHTIGGGDELANRFGVRTFRNGQPENIGGTCVGYFIRADGTTVVINGGQSSGNVAFVALPEACYAVEGNFSLAIKCQGSGVTGTLRIVDGVVSRTSTDAAVDPGTLIPSIEALIDAIDNAVETLPEDYTELNDTVINIREVLLNSFVGIDQEDNWEQGSLNTSTGASSSSTTRIRSNWYMLPAIALSLTVPFGMKAYWFRYSAPNISGYVDNSGGWIDHDVLIPADGKYYKLLLAYSDDSTITPEAAEDCETFIYEPTDNTLSKAGKAADAKTVGDVLKEIPVNLDWEQGGQSTSTGAASSATNRIRTGYYLKPTGCIRIPVPVGYKMLYLRYTGASVSSYTGEASEWSTGEIKLENPESYYKVVMAKTDDADLTPEAGKSVTGFDHLTRPFLASTYDNTDRTAEIRSMLTMYGCVYMGAGDFYTTGVTMPDDSKIIGNGTNTRLVLSANGYAITLGSRCTVENLDIAGSTTDAIVWDESDEGGKHGIHFTGDARRGFIINCNIHGFTGGGLTMEDTGTTSQQGVNVTGCNFWNCFAGINIKKLSEFHRFANCCVNLCRYGCVDNGGNNIFANCTFASNTDHFILDNADGDKTNNAHGSITGCNFQHSGFDKDTMHSSSDGNMITIINSASGLIFEGCFLGDGHMVIEDSYRITFVGCQCMEDVYLDVSGGGLVMFSGCEMRTSFESNTTITNNTAVKFNSCYTSNGTPVDPTD